MRYMCFVVYGHVHLNSFMSMHECKRCCALIQTFKIFLFLRFDNK